MAIDPTPRNAAHLWRRAAFGATPEQIERTVADGIEATVEAMFDHRRAVDAGEPLRRPGFQAYETTHLNTWFLRLATTSPTPAIERLTWFWHGHFATNVDKFEDTELLHAQLMTFRRHGMGRFDDLLKMMSRDPAMILWLDLQTSVIGRSNENYARELMELFSLGVDGGYSQRDVVEVGRAFTGNTLEEDPPPARAVLSSALHDDAEKTIFGRTGRWSGDDVVDMIVERPECHRFVATRFWTRYAGTAPPPSVIDDLAASFRADLLIRDLVVAMFTHPAFYADDVHRGLVAQPVETIANAVRGFEVELVDVVTSAVDEEEDEDDDAAPGSGIFPFWVPLELLEEMGQYVGHPPNVGGWPHNEPWIDATRSIGRLNAGILFAEQVLEADTDAVRRIAAAAERDPVGAIGELMAAFGHLEWSDETGDAITTALSTPSDGFPTPLANAITIAFTSPEVTLS